MKAMIVKAENPEMKWREVFRTSGQQPALIDSRIQQIRVTVTEGMARDMGMSPRQIDAAKLIPAEPD